MVVDERSRYALFAKLGEVLGEEEASTLMSHLPPVGWADVATKRDLDHLGDQLRAEMHQLRGDLRSEMHQLHGEVHVMMGRQTRLLRFGMLASNATLVSLTFAAARLA